MFLLVIILDVFMFVHAVPSTVPVPTGVEILLYGQNIIYQAVKACMFSTHSKHIEIVNCLRSYVEDGATEVCHTEDVAQDIKELTSAFVADTTARGEAFCKSMCFACESAFGCSLTIWNRVDGDLVVQQHCSTQSSAHTLHIVKHTT